MKNGFTEKELDTTINVLNKFQKIVSSGDLDGWGLDNSAIYKVKYYLENIKNGVYSENTQD